MLQRGNDAGEPLHTFLGGTGEQGSAAAAEGDAGRLAQEEAAGPPSGRSMTEAERQAALLQTRQALRSKR